MAGGYLLSQHHQPGSHARGGSPYSSGPVGDACSNIVNAGVATSFLLTGADRYLDPYRLGVQEVDANLTNLRDLTTDNPSQQRRIEQLRQVTAAKLGELAETIELRRQKGQQAAVEVVISDRGKNAMDEIRRIISEMDNEENDLLRLRDREAKATSQFTTSSILLGGLIAAALAVIIGVVVQRSITGPLTRSAICPPCRRRRFDAEGSNT